MQFFQVILALSTVITTTRHTASAFLVASPTKAPPSTITTVLNTANESKFAAFGSLVPGTLLDYPYDDFVPLLSTIEYVENDDFQQQMKGYRSEAATTQRRRLALLAIFILPSVISVNIILFLKFWQLL